jgi:hypothetical protein
MVGNFTALALALVIMALVASFAVCIFAFELFTLMRERAIRAAANIGGWNRRYTRCPPAGRMPPLLLSATTIISPSTAHGGKV